MSDGRSISLTTVSKDADCAKRTVSKTCLASTKPVGAGIHGSLPEARIIGAVM